MGSMLEVCFHIRTQIKDPLSFHIKIVLQYTSSSMYSPYVLSPLFQGVQVSVPLIPIDDSQCPPRTHDHTDKTRLLSTQQILRTTHTRSITQTTPTLLPNCPAWYCCALISHLHRSWLARVTSCGMTVIPHRLGRRARARYRSRIPAHGATPRARAPAFATSWDDFSTEGPQSRTCFLVPHVILRAVRIPQGRALTHGDVILVERELAAVKPSAEG